MRLLAAASAGLLAALVVAWLQGQPVALPRLHRSVERPSRLQRRRRWLRQAGARVTVAQFYGVSAGAGLAAAVLAYALIGVPSLAVVAGVLCALSPHVYYQQRRKHHLAEVAQAWPDGLRDLAASLHQRLPLHQAVTALANTGPAPLRRAFAHYEATARATGMVAALERIKEELADPTSDRVLEVLIVAGERGSSGDVLTRILGDLADQVRADLRTAEEIETARTEPRLSMATAAAGPWVLLVIFALSHSPFRDYYASGAGTLPIVVAAVMTAAALATGHALGRIPVEPRVFPNQEEATRS